VGGFFYIRRSIANPLLSLADSMHRLAANARDVEIAGAERSDEIGEMARAVNVFRENSIELAVSQRLLADQASLLAEKLAAEQQLTETQRNFVLMASHEFRTPLAVIDGHAQRLMSTRAVLSAEDVAERATKIRGAVLRLTSLIETLINSSRLLEGHAELYIHPQPVNLVQLVNDVCKLHRDILSTVNIRAELGPEPVWIEGDAKLLFQAVSNVISNAIKYSGPHELIEITVDIKQDVVSVIIADQGIGISEDDRQRLFERYYRGGNTSGITGTGIGLFLVKTVVDLHRGNVEVRSEIGRGSVFTITLPRTFEEG
jgi:signal transduction histidine kinase